MNRPKEGERVLILSSNRRGVLSKAKWRGCWLVRFDDGEISLLTVAALRALAVRVPPE